MNGPDFKKEGVKKKQFPEADSKEDLTFICIR